jgi:glycosyltransferase involved in cell wall biosynthesis
MYLLEHPEISKKLGDNARDLAVTEFDWKILINKLEQFYYSILDKSKEKIG